MSSDGSPFIKYFAVVEDPRIDRHKRHLLTDIIVLVLCGHLAGIDDFEHIEEFARLREPWFRRLLALPYGIPSHDTMNRVFARIDVAQFEQAFVAWMSAVTRLTDGEIIPIDGKTLRSSFDRASGKAPIHMVSAWACANGVVLGQVKVDDKSNEITAIPRLLDMLDVAGCLVTIDAMGCQRAIAEKIVSKGADYTLALKGNQEKLYHDVIALFCRHRRGSDDVTSVETFDQGHGRREERHYFLCAEIDDIRRDHAWPHLASVGLARRTSVVGGVKSTEDRYYINSYVDDVQRFADAVRGHWLIESNLHWSLDVTFREDDSRVRTGNAAANLSIMRRAALNMLRRDNAKGSLKKKQMRCAVSEDQLSNMLFGRVI